METELKLLFDPKYTVHLLANRLLHPEGSELTRDLLISTYYDTPDLWFHRHGASQRVRAIKGKGCVQTMKGSSMASGGLYQRDEWETPLLGRTPDLKTLQRQVQDDRHWTNLLSPPGLQKRLVPLFITEVKRSSWILQLEHGAGDLVPIGPRQFRDQIILGLHLAGLKGRDREGQQSQRQGDE